MNTGNEVADMGSRLALLRQRAQTLRSLTADPELRWELVHAEAVADVMLAPAMRFNAPALRANMAYLGNLLGAIEGRITRQPE